jgi:hypothetical protein
MLSSCYLRESGERLKIRIPPLKLQPRPCPPQTAKETPKPEPSSRRKGDINSETFKQPWTMEEQHLLEKLLIEIPKGEKNRFVLLVM